MEAIVHDEKSKCAPLAKLARHCIFATPREPARAKLFTAESLRWKRASLPIGTAQTSSASRRRSRLYSTRIMTIGLLSTRTLRRTLIMSLSHSHHMATNWSIVSESSNPVGCSEPRDCVSVAFRILLARRRRSEVSLGSTTCTGYTLDLLSYSKWRAPLA
jgi:hypothetical protein